MIMVLFELTPKVGQEARYFDLAARLADASCARRGQAARKRPCTRSEMQPLVTNP